MSSGQRSSSGKLGHVMICRPCAAKVGLQHSFLMINSKRPCEGCGTEIGYECMSETHEVDGKTYHFPRFGRLVAPYMEMWRNQMWPVAFGIALQDFAGVHVHDWTEAIYDYTRDCTVALRCPDCGHEWGRS